MLETLDVEQRLELVTGWARETLAEIDLKDKIRTDVSEGMEKRQREFLLREQMSAIRKELGEDGDGDVVEEYRAKIERGRHARGRPQPRPSASSAAWSAPPSSRPSTAGSAPTSTG